MTKSSTTCSLGDIVLVPFPFSDLSQRKLRPAVVISGDAYRASRGDVVLVALTTQPQQEHALALADWRGAGLPKPTWVKPLVMSLSARMLLKTLGALMPSDWPSVTAAMHLMIAPRFR